MNIFLRQELLDPQMAPVVGRCKCCGGEIYSRDEAERYGGMCPECRLAAEGENDCADDGPPHPALRATFPSRGRLQKEADSNG